MYGKVEAVPRLVLFGGADAVPAHTMIVLHVFLDVCLWIWYAYYSSVIMLLATLHRPILGHLLCALV